MRAEAYSPTASSCPESVGAAKQGIARRCAAGQRDRERPPDSSRQKKNRIGARMDVAINGDEAHGGEEVCFGKTEAFRDPGGLERGEVEASAGKALFQEGGEPAAGRTSAVVEEPAAEPVAIINFCNF